MPWYNYPYLMNTRAAYAKMEGAPVTLVHQVVQHAHASLQIYGRMKFFDKNCKAREQETMFLQHFHKSDILTHRRTEGYSSVLLRALLRRLK